jgi:hypothetical protein
MRYIDSHNGTNPKKKPKRLKEPKLKMRKGVLPRKEI